MRELTLIYSQHPGDEAKAYEMGEKAKAAFPNDPDFARALGILAYRKAEYRESVRLLRDSSQKFDKDGELSYYLGMDYYQLKERKESKESLQRALGLNIPSQMAGDASKVLAELK